MRTSALKHSLTHHLGSVLRDRRLDERLSQTELEALTGIPKARISRYENGHVEPSIVSLEVLAKGLGTEASMLLYWAELDAKGES